MADANLHPMSMEYAEEHSSFYDGDCSIDRHIADYEINVEESHPATGQLHTHFKFL